MSTATLNETKRVAIASIQRAKQGLVLRNVDKKNKDYLNMKSSIKQDGLLNAISVRPNPDAGTPVDPADENSANHADYLLIEGDHRLTAHEDLTEEGETGFDTINVTIQPEMTDVAALLLQCIGNSQGRKTKPAQYANALFTILNESPMTQKELAQKLSKSQPWVSTTLDLAALPDKVQKLLDEGTIKVVHGVQLTRLFKYVDILTSKGFTKWVNKAKKNTTSDFSIEVDEYLKGFVKKLNAEKRGQEPSFDGPAVKLAKKDFITDLYNGAKDGSNEFDEKTLAYILGQDQESYDAAKEKHDASVVAFKNKIVARDAKQACKKMKVKFEKGFFADMSVVEIVEACAVALEGKDKAEDAAAFRARLV